jgi:hypothetical protein
VLLLWARDASIRVTSIMHRGELLCGSERGLRCLGIHDLQGWLDVDLFFIMEQLSVLHLYLDGLHVEGVSAEWPEGLPPAGVL